MMFSDRRAQRSAEFLTGLPTGLGSIRTRTPLWLVLLVAAGVACGDSDKKKRRDGGVDAEVPTDATVGQDTGAPGGDAALDGSTTDGTVGMTDGMVEVDGATDGDASLDGDTPDGGGGTIDADVDGAVADAGVDPDAAAELSITGANITFGLAPCGGDAPANQTFSFTNTGGQTLTWSASLSSTTAFQLQGATNGVVTGQVAGGQTGSLTIAASPVLATATAGDPITATLTITSDALPGDNNTVDIPVSVTPQGAVLELNPSGGVNFTAVQYNQTSRSEVTIRNTGNAAATINVTQPAVSQFKLYTLGTSTEAGSITVPAATGGTPGTLRLDAAFAPTTTGTLTSTAGLAATSAVCTGTGANPTQISLTGTGTGNGFVASLASPMDDVNCGAAAEALPTARVSVGNFTSSAITFAATLKSAPSPFEVVEPGPITLNPAETTQITVRLRTGQALTTTAPRTEFTDTVVLTPTVAAGQPALSALEIDGISTEVQGALLAFEPVSGFDFTTATAVDPQVATFKIVNRGNLPATPTLTMGGTHAAQFTLLDGASTAPAAVPTGTTGTPGEGTFRVSFRPPAGDPNEKSATVSFTAAGVLCQTSTPTLELTGETETPGFSLETPSSLTFDVDCPVGSNVTGGTNSITAAPFADVTFRNTGSQDLTWTADLVGNYFDVDVDDGVVPAGQTQTIRVTPRALPFPASTVTNFYGGTLTIRPQVLGQDPQTITLTQTARGAVLTATRSPTDFGFVHTGLNAPLTPAFSVTNSGNILASLTVTPNVTRPGASNPLYSFNGAAANTAFPLTVDVGTTVDVSGVFTPGSTNADAVESSVDAVFSADTLRICDRLPELTPFIGTGTTAIVYYSDDDIAFPTTACGTAPSPVTVIVYNTGNEPFVINDLQLDLGAGSPFNAYFGVPGLRSVTVPSAVNNTPGTAALTIAPKFVPVSTADNTVLADTLTVPYTIGTEPQTPQQITIELPVSCP